MSSRPSIKDIAELAGVATSTVSRALADSPRISQSTRSRVQGIAASLGYTPSAAARSLVTGASHMLGVVASTLADPYAAAVMGGIEAASAAQDYRLLIAASGGDPHQEIESVRLLLRHQPDGVIILSSRAGSIYQDVLPMLRTPVVFVNSDQGQGCKGAQVFSIATDNEQGGWLATRHLLEQGHQRVAYLSGPGSGRSQQARAAGYVRALAEAGLPSDPAWLLAGDGSIASGRAALALIIAASLHQRPTAIFCYNDLSALGLLAEAHCCGLRIPEDLAVVGFDNVPYAALSLPPLTTIDQRKEEMGRLAVSTVLAAYRGAAAANVRLSSNLIVRGSSGKMGG